MAQYGTYVICGAGVISVDVDQTIFFVTLFRTIEVAIKRKKCGSRERMEEPIDFVVLHSRTTDVCINMLGSDACCFENCSLVLGKVLIQDNQAVAFSLPYSRA